MKYIKILLIISLMLSLLACSKLTKENYDQLSVGMQKEEIESIIGSPNDCSETLGVVKCIWGSKADTNITVTFVADRAINLKSKGLE